MNARQSFERLGDDPSRTASPYTLPYDPPDEDLPSVTEDVAVNAVLACLYNQTAGAYGQSARIWGEWIFDQLSKLQIGTSIVLLDGETVPSTGKNIRAHLFGCIHAEVNRLIQEMDPDELEAYL
ncbi:hypothetical protein AADG64_09555 [Achromobacter xylosoxidans]|uniref:hypothetical protein n=1 Tax=Alcaligenes xylosoxydans xylosoxydans TaxID=85698 RepID=UPI002A7668D8|nr:hypothetical protein [Achromobacter xylosoxidans]WPQ34344.1 hypothetical protein SLH34_27640 [Achromobacter xylosoxidans]